MLPVIWPVNPRTLKPDAVGGAAPFVASDNTPSIRVRIRIGPVSVDRASNTLLRAGATCIRPQDRAHIRRMPT